MQVVVDFYGNLKRDVYSLLAEEVAVRRSGLGLFLILCLLVVYWQGNPSRFEAINQISPTPTPPHVREIIIIATPQAPAVFGMGALPATPPPTFDDFATIFPLRRVTTITDTIALTPAIIHKPPR